MSLEEQTNVVKEKLAGAEGFGKVVKVDFEGEGVIVIDATATPPTVSNDDRDADMTLIVSEENFEGLMDGSLNPQMAMMTGKIKIQGDMSVAFKLGEIFS